MLNEYEPQRDENGIHKDVHVIKKRTRNNYTYNCQCNGRDRCFSSYTMMTSHFKSSEHTNYLKQLDYKYVCQQLEAAKAELDDKNAILLRTRSQNEVKQKKRRELQKKIYELEEQREEMENKNNDLQIGFSDYETIVLRYDTLGEAEMKKLAENIQTLNAECAENIQTLNAKCAENIQTLNAECAENIKRLNAEKHHELNLKKITMCIVCQE